MCACLSVDRALSVCLAALCALLSPWLWVMPGSSHGMETVSFGSLATLPTETTCILSNNKHAVFGGGEALSLSSPPAQLCSPAQRNMGLGLGLPTPPMNEHPPCPRVHGGALLGA